MFKLHFLRNRHKAKSRATFGIEVLWDPLQQFSSYSPQRHAYKSTCNKKHFDKINLKNASILGTIWDPAN